ncbi:MAG TPA: EamA family transporter [Bryobacteraceae bacterium]|jgi:drug/metabolite transporter (DMT)-like permease|nr:EamA family transporter [Bryobacteraceae bacterium]
MKWVLVALCVLSTTVGDVFRSLGMRRHGEISDFRPSAIGSVFAAVARNWMVIVSTCAMAVSFFSFMKLVSIAPMSFAVPMSAATFIPETLLAKFLLRENVDWRRWTGIALIVVGVVFISR